MWLADGMFQTSVPSIFFQLYTIMGAVTQVHKGIECEVALALAYALLQNKQKVTHTKVLQAIAHATRVGVTIQYPTTFMTDFELAIINSFKSEFETESIKLCLFHLCQNVYRQIQAHGLQEQYRDEKHSSINSRRSP